MLSILYLTLVVEYWILHKNIFEYRTPDVIFHSMYPEICTKSLHLNPTRLYVYLPKEIATLIVSI